MTRLKLSLVVVCPLRREVESLRFSMLDIDPCVAERQARRPAVGTRAEFGIALLALLPHLRAFARSLTRNAASADDLVQDTLLKALSSYKSFRAGSNLRAWMFTIQRNSFYSDVRKRRHEVEDVDGLHAGRLIELPSQDGVVDLQDFKRSFARLPAGQREALTLIGGAGCSYEEAADICACAVGTIKSRINRGRARLAELLGLTETGCATPV